MSELTRLQTTVTRKLAELGATLSEVVNNLNAAGITGQPRKCANCPVANYLCRELAKEGFRVFSVEVNHVECKVWLTRIESCHSGTTQAVSEFLSAFDNTTVEPLAKI